MYITRNEAFKRCNVVFCDQEHLMPSKVWIKATHPMSFADFDTFGVLFTGTNYDSYELTAIITMYNYSSVIFDFCVFYNIKSNNQLDPWFEF